MFHQIGHLYYRLIFFASFNKKHDFDSQKKKKNATFFIYIFILLYIFTKKFFYIFFNVVAFGDHN